MHLTESFKRCFQEVLTYARSTGTCLSSVRDRSSWINGLTEAQCPPVLAHATSLTCLWYRENRAAIARKASSVCLTVYDTNHKDYDPTIPLCSQDTHPLLSHVLNLQCSCHFLYFTWFALHCLPAFCWLSLGFASCATSPWWHFPQ